MSLNTSSPNCLELTISPHTIDKQFSSYSESENTVLSLLAVQSSIPFYRRQVITDRLASWSKLLSKVWINSRFPGVRIVFISLGTDQRGRENLGQAVILTSTVKQSVKVSIDVVVKPRFKSAQVTGKNSAKTSDCIEMNFRDFRESRRFPLTSRVSLSAAISFSVGQALIAIWFRILLLFSALFLSLIDTLKS